MRRPHPPLNPHPAERCLLEWEGEGSPPLPLLKDLFASERRKAKVLNFSIAYGKTAHGLSKDWKVSLEEAKDTVDRWYADRPEVGMRHGRARGRVCRGGARARQGARRPGLRAAGWRRRAARAFLEQQGQPVPAAASELRAVPPHHRHHPARRSASGRTSSGGRRSSAAT